MVDLSSSLDEEGLIHDTSWDEEFARRLFGDLNRGVLGSPDDNKVIILIDSDEEEEVCEEDIVNADTVASSTVKSLAPTAFADDINKGRSLDRAIGGSSSGGDEAGLP
jgi:hypothetical protein